MKEKYRYFKRSMGIFLSGALLLGLVSSVGKTEAKAEEPGDNIQVGKALQSTFKYEKKIDMTNGDRTQIPNVDFSYNLHSVEGEESYSIGKEYRNQAGEVSFVIEKGSLPDGFDSTALTQVQFRSSDGYDEKLTALLDGYGSAEAIINHIIKFDWGEMRSSEGIQTAIAREAITDVEKEQHRLGQGNGWPADTVAWRCFVQGVQGSAEEGCQSLMEYPFDTFDYVNEFDLKSNPVVVYYAYSYHRPLLSHRELGADGKYNSVSKPLFTPERYDEIRAALGEKNQDGEGKKVFRFLVREVNDYGDAFAPNEEVKILDYISGIEDGGILLFDSLQEADAFYLEAADLYRKEGENSWNGSYFTDLVPRAKFTNSYAKKSEDALGLPEGGSEIEKEKPPISPNKNESMTNVKQNSGKEEGTIKRSVTSKAPKTGDSRAFPITVMLFLFAVLSLVGLSRFPSKKEEKAS